MATAMQLDPNPPEFPAVWACAWGEDSYGLWQALEIKGIRQVMRWIVPGEFMMGSLEDEHGRSRDETRHRVVLARGYWLADTACTQALWQATMGDNPSHFKDGPELPVESISWDDSQKFLAQANQYLEGQFKLRLPSEAEWEYACRAGSRTAFHWGDELNTDQANYDGNYPGNKGTYRQRTLPAQHFKPNDWGLYQMHGNVWEWCADWWAEYPEGLAIDPAGPADGRIRVLRGGGWINAGRGLRSAYRNHFAPDDRSRITGLRLAGG